MKVLVIDDEPVIRTLMRDVLSQRGIEVVTAGDADEAVARFLEGGVNMMILDHRMPGASGVELHRLLSEEFGSGGRAGALTRKKLPPVLIVTGSPQDREVIVAAFGESVVGVLPKPFVVEELVKIVVDTLGRRPSGGRPEQQ